ncbi:MAG: hypothetical protein KF802_02370 [Bdellovibrionaceae bacterium]|nr:hypothetical protein [Pseudobdellovibrionaceae bacterium]
MKSFNLKNCDRELRDLLEKSPMGTKRIYVLDSSGEVDKVLDFEEPQKLFDFVWDSLHSVPLVYVVKIKHIYRVVMRVNEFSVEYEMKRDGTIVLNDYQSLCSVTKSGWYSKLN